MLAAGAVEVSKAVASLSLGGAWLEGRAGIGASRSRCGLGVEEGVPRKGAGLWQGAAYGRRGV